MKNIFFLLTLILTITVCAQNNSFEDANVFVRVYDLQGNKIGKGDIVSISDTTLQLIKRHNTTDIPVSDIGFVKTKYSGGNNILIGAISGTGIGFFSGDPTIIAAGAGAGAVVGALTILFKKSESFQIDGDKTKLKALKDLIIE